MITAQFYNIRYMTPERAVFIARKLGATDISLKMVDGTKPYWELGCWKGLKWDPDCNKEFLPKYKRIAALAKQYGISVSGWGYHYGRTRLGKDIIGGEIQAVYEAREAIGFSTYYIDAEIEWRNRSKPGDAAKLCRGLKDGGLWIALESFRFPTFHTGMKWREWSEHVDGWAPQVYWLLAHNPIAQMTRSIDEHRAIANLPIIPILPTFKERGWEPTERELKDAAETANTLGVSGIGVWDASWFSGKMGIVDNVGYALKRVKSIGFSKPPKVDDTPSPVPNEKKVSPCDALKLWSKGDAVFINGKKVISIHDAKIAVDGGDIVPLGDFLTSDNVTIHGDKPTAATHVVTAAWGLHIRSGPGKNYPVVGSYTYGDKVIVLDEKGGWSKVGENKWVYSKYLKEV